MSRAPLVLMLAVVVGSATAQPVARPTVTAPSPGPGDPQFRGRQIASTPLTREEAQTLRQRFKDALARRAAQAPKSQALREAGLGDENDAVEAAAAAASAGDAGPIGIGLAQARPSGASAGVDPGLDAVTRLKLRARLDRDPTTAEVAAELRTFDARVEQANRWLAANRARIAKSFASAGALPPDFDHEALRGAAAGARMETAQDREAHRALFRALLTQPDQGVPTVPSVPPGDPVVPGRPGIGPIVAPTPPTPRPIVRDPPR